MTTVVHKSSLSTSIELKILLTVRTTDAVINRVIDPPFGRKDVPSEFQPE